jgi:tetratricopeptide (TPR) repeat protein
VNVSDGFHLWSETYDRVLDDVFALQDEIARAVAAALNVKLLGTSKTARPVDPESYALVLRANYAAQLASKSSFEVAVDLYRKAIDLDPKSARPWAGLARCLLEQSAFGLADHEQGYRNAKEAIRRAMELDDELPETYEAMSWILAAFDFRFREAEVAIEKAYSLAPNNPRILATYAVNCIVLGRFEKGLSVARRAVELDPLDPGAYQQLGRVFFWAGRYAEAEATIRRCLELSPGIAAGNGLLSLTLFLQGKLEESLEFLNREDAGGYRSCGEAALFHTMGRKADSDRALAALLTEGDQWAFQVASVYAWRGEIDQAFEMLEKAYRLRDTGIPLTKVHPLLRNLHGDPRWPGLLKKIGLSE